MARTLIVPGLHDRGHSWQLWLETRLMDAARVRIGQPSEPDLAAWSDDLQRALDKTNTPCWLIARDFGALVTMSLLPNIRDSVLGLMLVAPASPEHFGLSPSLASNPELPGLIFASTHDSNQRLTSAAFLAERYGLRLVQQASPEPDAYANNGAWPEALAAFKALMHAHGGVPQGNITD